MTTIDALPPSTARRGDAGFASADSATSLDSKRDGFELSESGDDNLEFDTQPPCGSLELGQQRQHDSEGPEYPAQATDAEKHLTPRAATKEFSFPKSN